MLHSCRSQYSIGPLQLYTDPELHFQNRVHVRVHPAPPPQFSTELGREREKEGKQPQRERFPDPKRITQAGEASWESSVHSAWALTTYPVLTMAVSKAGQPNPASSMTRQGWKEIFQDVSRGRSLAVFPTRFQAQARLARKSKTVLHLPLLTSPHKTPPKHMRKRKSIMRACPCRMGSSRLLGWLLQEHWPHS